jgi:transcriptional regulator with XRE-family HTH domain
VQYKLTGGYFLSKGGIFMTTAPTINMTATGSNIKSLIKANGLKVAEIQAVYGFNTPQSIFKWMRGEAMPSIDNLVILAHILGVSIDRIIIINE